MTTEEYPRKNGGADGCSSLQVHGSQEILNVTMVLNIQRSDKQEKVFFIPIQIFLN